MKSELVYQALELVKDKTLLINMVSKRVRQLNLGRPALVDTLPTMGQADIALMEIIEGKVIVKVQDEPAAL